METERPRKQSHTATAPVPRPETSGQTTLFSQIYHDTGFVAQTTLGQGESGQVVLGYEAASGEWCAIKIFPRTKQVAFDKEVRALSRLSRCPHVIHMQRYLDFKPRRAERNEFDLAYIVMDIGRGNLLQLCGSRDLNEREARFIFLQMAEGVCAAHRVGFCHHDVKLENFVLGEDGLVKLIDFGASLDLATDLVRAPQPDERLIDGAYVAGSPAYSSQQVLLGLPRSPEKTDIYGLGVSLYRILCGRYPFCVPESDSLDTLMRNVAQDRLEFPCAISEEARGLLRAMLARREEDRPGWSALARRPWVKQK